MRARAVAIAACLIAGSILGACNAPAPATSPTSTSHATASPSATPTDTGLATATPFPTAFPGLTAVTPAVTPSEPPNDYPKEAASPDPAFAFGYVIEITTAGFHPNWLVAPCCRPIMFVNLTSKANSVGGVELPTSPLIPPGASWSWTPPNAESVAYGSITFPTMTGVIQVNQTTD